MDPISFVIELLFALLFVGALVSYLRHRDVVSRDVMLMFGSVASLFVVAGLSAAFGPLPPVVTGFTLVLLFAQPILTLRVVARRCRPVAPSSSASRTSRVNSSRLFSAFS